MYSEIIQFIKSLFPNQDFIPLHEPRFLGNEKKYLNECIDSTFVSSVGKYVDEFEIKLAQFTGAKYAVATVNGTAGLHIALLLAGVESGEEVITQPLTFVATCNAIAYCNANPVFLDVDKETMGLSPNSLQEFLEKNTTMVEGKCINKLTGKRIRACVPMHTFGHPCKIDEIADLCAKFNLFLIEDAAESLGSKYKGKHTGTFGRLGVISFNGNKIITSGGGGCIITDDEELAVKAKHLTTTAKKTHAWEYVHDELGYNYRMPNINAALLCAQLESLSFFVTNKRELAEEYENYFNHKEVAFFKEPQFANSNYWLNSLIMKDKESRDAFLKETNSNGVMTRPIWELMSKLDMYKNYQHDDLQNSKYFADRVVNIPSSVRIK